MLPGATVALVNQDTNISREVSTNEAGQFNFSAVNPGTYTLKVSIQGYKTHESKDIRVGTQQFITLDVTLELGTIQELDYRHRRVAAIETSSASSGAVLDKTALDTLPNAGRNAFMMALTVPNVIPTGNPTFNRQQDQTNASLVSLAGGPVRANNYMLDGVPITDLRNRPVIMPSIEALQEVKVQVSTFDAEMGRTGGGVFNTVGRSGSNEFHGSGFVQNRPTWGTANNFFQELAGIPKPEGLDDRLAGGGVGGPVVKDRTFFWFAAEGYRSNTTRNGSLRFPTEREKRGDFSQSFNAQGQLVQIFDPMSTVCDASGTNCTRSAFQGQRHPAEPHQPCRGEHGQLLPDAAAGRVEREHQLPQHGPNRRSGRRLIRQDHPQVQRPDLARRLLPLQQHRRALRELLGAWAHGEQALRRPERLPPAAARAHPRPQQHLRPERQLGRDVPRGLDTVRRQRHADAGLRPGVARLQPELRERARGEEVPAREHRGLR